MFQKTRRLISAISAVLLFGLMFCQSVMAATPNLPSPATPTYDNSFAVKLWAFFGVLLGFLVILSLYWLVIGISKYNRAAGQGRAALKQEAKEQVVTSVVAVVVLSLGTTVIFALVLFAAKYLPGA